MKLLENTPSDWNLIKISKITERLSNGLTYEENLDASDLITRIETISNGSINLSRTGRFEAARNHSAFLLRPGDILYSHINSLSHLGKVAYFDLDCSLYHGMNLLVVRANEKIDSKYLYYILVSEIGRAYVWAYAKRAVAQSSLSTKDISSFRIPLPPLPEQKKIAEILGACDEAIEAQERLIAQKQQRKKGLMQRLLTGKTRFPQFAGTPWKEVRLGDVFKERKETKRDDLELLSVTGTGGVVKRDGLNRKDTSSEDKSKYKRVCPGDIAYNTMRMWQGVSGLSRYEGIVSPAYTIVTPGNVMDPTFSAYFFKLPKTVSLFHRYSQGLVNDTLNLKYPNFKVIKVTIPERDEQEAIGLALAVQDEEITLQQNKLEQLKQQKKGLMQQLLTGKVRVKA